MSEEEPRRLKVASSGTPASGTPAWVTALIAVLFVGLLGGVIVAFWTTANNNREKDMLMQQECIAAGGTYINGTGCLMLTAPSSQG
jgi:hypothetical protein